MPDAGDAVSVTGTVAGIAETGTLMVRSGPDIANAAHFLTDTHVAVVDAARIVGAYEDAFALLRAGGAPMPRNVTLITGPSRSSDIERILQIGVHGPRTLHVVVVRCRPGAVAASRAPPTAPCSRRRSATSSGSRPNPPTMGPHPPGRSVRPPRPRPSRPDRRPRWSRVPPPASTGAPRPG